MDICSDRHEGICFESRCCPLCDMKDDLDGEIEALNDEINDLNKRIDHLESLE